MAAQLTVLDGIIACGIDNTIQGPLNSSPASRVATQIFNDDFTTCLTLTDEEIDNSFKVFSGLTQALGQVRLMPGMIKMVKAFTQHVAHTIRLELNPEEVPFLPVRMASLIRQRVIQKKFESDNNNDKYKDQRCHGSDTSNSLPR